VGDPKNHSTSQLIGAIARAPSEGPAD
jgi:hypothetical protein